MLLSQQTIQAPMRISRRLLHKAPQRLIRFVITGGLATVVHQSTAMGIIAWMGMGYGPANASGFLTGTSVAYILNTRWSFKKRFRWRSMATYWAVSCLGLLLSYVIGSGCEAVGWPYWAVTLITIGLVPIVSYTCHSRWTYR